MSVETTRNPVCELHGRGRHGGLACRCVRVQLRGLSWLRNSQSTRGALLEADVLDENHHRCPESSRDRLRRMRPVCSKIVVPWSALLLASACEASILVEGDEPTFETVEALLREQCVDCHSPDDYGYAFLDMSGDLYGSIVHGLGFHHFGPCYVVEPGDPGRSLLWHKIAGSHLESCSGRGRQMPLADDLSTTQPLPQDAMDLVEAWILAGAPR